MRERTPPLGFRTSRCAANVAAVRVWAAWIGGAAVVAALGVALESRARACSCVQPPSPRAAAAEATAVFEGRTFGVHREAGKVRFGFEVSRVWKGDVGATVDVYSNAASSMCGRSFEAGVPYLVYARHSPAGVLVDTMCSRTRASRSAAEDFAELGAGTSPARPELASKPGISIEPPRIEPTPPPSPPNKRGCSVAGDDDRTTPWWLAIVAPALRRRRPPTPEFRP